MVAPDQLALSVDEPCDIIWLTDPLHCVAVEAVTEIVRPSDSLQLTRMILDFVHEPRDGVCQFCVSVGCYNGAVRLLLGCHIIFSRAALHYYVSLSGETHIN